MNITLPFDVAPIRKALVAAGAAIAVIVAALTDGALSMDEAVAIVAAVGSVVGVYKAKNEPVVSAFARTAGYGDDIVTAPVAPASSPLPADTVLVRALRRVGASIGGQSVEIANGEERHVNPEVARVLTEAGAVEVVGDDCGATDVGVLLRLLALGLFCLCALKFLGWFPFS